MQAAWVCAILLLAPVSSSDTGSSSNVNPISKVMSMLAQLQGEIIKEGAEQQGMYNEFSHMCQSRSRDLHHESKTSKSKVAELSANIEKCGADIALLQEKISTTAAGIADTDNELKNAEAIRAKEAANFKSEEQTLLTMTSSIERSITIVERGNSGGASLAQVEKQRMESIASVFQSMVEASSFNEYDSAKLSALVQTADSESDDAEGSGAPSAAAFEGSSGGVVEMLGGLLEKAQKNLDDARQAESASTHSFEMQRQALQDKLKTLNKELGESKKMNAQRIEKQATAEGDLEATKKDLAESKKELEELHHECLDKANSFEESASARNEELKALAEAKKLIGGSTGGATKVTYGLVQTSASFLQVASKAKSSSSQSQRALHEVRHLALTHRSEALGKLAASVEEAIQSAEKTGADPFAKVKGMIESMIAQLEKKAAGAATKQAYCDKAMAETSASKEDKEDALEKLKIQIDVFSAESKKLKSEVFELGKELQSLSLTQAEMDKLRMEEKALYAKNKPVMEQGLEGIKTALKVLRDYYAQGEDAAAFVQGSGDGASSGIIGMLEVIESDFSKGLAGMTSGEESAANEYETATNENQVAKATKEQDQKYKKKEAVSLDKSIMDLQSDQTGAHEEMSAVQQYFTSLKKECAGKVDSYEERKKRRDEEMAGLKEAITSLQDSPSSFLQQGMLRGAR